MPRKVNLYIAMSLDGYIATKDDNLDFLKIVEAPGEDYGYSEFTSTIDTIIWGRKTFDKVLSFGEGVPSTGKKIYVISRTRTGIEEHVEYHSNVVGLIKELCAQEGKDIYCDGGAELVFELLKNKLLDRVIVSVIPHFLGEGIRLFKAGFPEQKLKFKKSISFPSGLVQLWYELEK